jgi:hypothetical protein
MTGYMSRGLAALSAGLFLAPSGCGTLLGPDLYEYSLSNRAIGDEQTRRERRIHEQHLTDFGSFENVKIARWEARGPLLWGPMAIIGWEYQVREGDTPRIIAKLFNDEDLEAGDLRLKAEPWHVMIKVKGELECPGRYFPDDPLTAEVAYMVFSERHEGTGGYLYLTN